jgi:hypothetical protein
VVLGQSIGINLFQGRHIDQLIGAGRSRIGGVPKLHAAAPSPGPARR